MLALRHALRKGRRMSRRKTLWWQMRHEWHVLETAGLAIVIVPFVVDLAYFGGGWRQVPIPEEARPVAARIISFERPIARYFWNQRRIVVARTDSGGMAKKSYWLPEVRGCEVGDAIAAFEYRGVIYLRPAPCG
jgi:hypothetical protein